MAKERAFFDKHRNARIRSGELSLTVCESDLPHMNKTELIQICNMIIPDAKAHHGLTRKEVEWMIMAGEANSKGNPIDPYRDQLLAFLQKYWEKVKDQLEIHCQADCYKCSDAMVLGCYLTNKKVLGKDEEHGKEEGKEASEERF